MPFHRGLEDQSGFFVSFPLLAMFVPLLRSPQSLGKHQAVDSIRGQVLHVSIEQARPSSIQNSIAVANNGLYRSSRSCDCSLADTANRRPQVRIPLQVRGARMELVR